MKHNLIGISGKLGSGKDTVGEMIQYLLWEKETPTVKRFSNYIDTGDFEIKKFGGKLKKAAGLLIGCTEEDFEDREFKENELGEHWIKYRIITKDLPNYYVSTLEEAQSICHSGQSRSRYVEVPMTPRLLLQLLGTECGREILHPNVWAYALFADYKAINPEQGVSMGNVIDYSNCEFPKWIITDMRFPNELEEVKSRNGLTIRVNLIGNEDTGDHPSETALDDAEFDIVINCEFGLDKLLDKVINIMPLIT